MKTIIPNIFIPDCKENLEFYQQIFDGELKNIVPRFDEADKIMHAELHINKNCILFFGDELEEAPPTPNIHIFLKFGSKEPVQPIYDGLKNGGYVQIELGTSFWGTLHAVVTDKNGITWDLDQ